MIVIEPLGGLGNQLFTYAIGLENATRLNTELRVDPRNFENYDWHNYELESFSNSIAGEAPPQSRSVLARSFGRQASSLASVVAEEKGTLFDPNFLEVPDGTRLRGYFQSWKYFQSVADLIQDQLWAPRRPSTWFGLRITELKDKSPWIGVHVRLGNYQTVTQMGVVAKDYYRRALNLLKDLGHNHKILVFTDSPELIAELGLFEDGFDYEIFVSDRAGSPLETMLLMSLADHLVIGNSTFSWWAAWLGRGIWERRVIYPRPWLDSAAWDDRDMPMPHWIGLSRERSAGKGETW